jgi:hypothetical protein
VARQNRVVHTNGNDQQDEPGVVVARPVKTARIANISAAIVLIIFVVVAIVMPYANAGASFGIEDQAFTAVIGLVLAGGLRLPARPRLRADADAVHLRSYLGNFRTVPWSAVVGVEFPRSVRFARLVLPGDESLAIYAIQRMDGEYAVQTMRALRALFAATRPNVG